MQEHEYCTNPNCDYCKGTGYVWCSEENRHEPCIVKVEVPPVRIAETPQE